MVEDWGIYHLDGKCPSQVSYVYNRLVCFQVRLGNLDDLSGGGALVLNHNSL